MKAIFIFIILIMCFIPNIKAQKTTAKSIAPKEDVKVNREYDEHGNLIKFDSIHSYSWFGDTTLLKSITPEDFKKQFDQSFRFFSDSTLIGNLYFDNFDLMFPTPFSSEQDSVFFKKFKSDSHFHNFRISPDSLTLSDNDFDLFFKKFTHQKGDTGTSKIPLHSKSMEEMMKIMEKQMLQLEEFERNFFNDQPKIKK